MHIVLMIAELPVTECAFNTVPRQYSKVQNYIKILYFQRM
jgi:hypothetical protein